MIAVVATDVGAWRAVRPVLRELWRRRARARAMLAEPATTFAAREGVPHTVLDQPSFGKRVSAVLRAETTALLLGTSLADVVERALVRELRSAGGVRRGTPSVGLLEAMLFVERRFGPALRDLPDRVACPDRDTADRLYAAGAGPEQAVVTGNPTLEEIAAGAGALGTDGGDPIDVLFVSQPVALAGPDRPFSIDERASLDHLVNALDTLEHLAPRGFRVRVRWHPTQPPNRLPDRRRNVLVESDAELDRLRGVARARVVVGMSSSLLVEARMLPRHAVAYLPGAYWERESAYAPYQGVAQARTPEELRACLAVALVTPAAPAPVAQHAGAACKIADLLTERSRA